MLQRASKLDETPLIARGVELQLNKEEEQGTAVARSGFEVFADPATTRPSWRVQPVEKQFGYVTARHGSLAKVVLYLNIRCLSDCLSIYQIVREQCRTGTVTYRFSTITVPVPVRCILGVMRTRSTIEQRAHPARRCSSTRTRMRTVRVLVY